MLVLIWIDSLWLHPGCFAIRSVVNQHVVLAPVSVLLQTCCSASKQLVDQGHYCLNISQDGSCSFSLTNSPTNCNLRMFWFLICANIWYIVCHSHLWKWRKTCRNILSTTFMSNGIVCYEFILYNCSSLSGWG